MASSATDLAKLEERVASAIIGAISEGRRVVWKSDLDGTLTKPDPAHHDQFRLSKRVASVIARISKTPIEFGIVTARPLRFVEDQFGEHVQLACSNGLEIRDGKERWFHPELDDWWVRQSVLFTRLSHAFELVDLKKTNDPSQAVRAGRRCEDMVYVEWLPTGLVLHTSQTKVGNPDSLIDTKMDSAIEILRRHTLEESEDNLVAQLQLIRSGAIDASRNGIGPIWSTVLMWQAPPPSEPFNGLTLYTAKGHLRFDSPIALDGGPVNKGTIMQKVAASGAFVVFSGDDWGDVPAAFFADVVLAVNQGAPQKLLDLADGIFANADDLTDFMNTTAGRVEKWLETQPGQSFGKGIGRPGPPKSAEGMLI